jgi:MoxR-like ATPase
MKTADITPLRQEAKTEVNPTVPESVNDVQTSPNAQVKNDLDAVAELADAHKQIVAEIEKRIIGQRRVVDQLLVALFARGHTLFVGVPGLAKTLLVASLAEALDLEFGRVQFTPDLLPADITGTDVLQEDEDNAGGVHRRVRFLPGPIFHNLILADEINRTPPKTQAALLQAMQERRVTVGTVTHVLPDPFQVFATRNPIEQEGTYPLPEAQLDRFLLEIHVDYPSENEEREIARRTTSADVGTVPRVVSANDVRALQALVPRIPVTEEAVTLAVALGRATRPRARTGEGSGGGVKEVDEYVRFGAGPRGSQALVLAAKARAALRGEAAADVEDVKALVVPVLRHRLVMSYRAEAEGVRDTDVLERVLRSLA